MKNSFVNLALLVGLLASARASSGDKSQVHRECVVQCYQCQCLPPNLQEFCQNQPWSQWLLQWSCPDECEYNCMWDTVEIIGIHQFNGKWPFLRLWGVQEPASALFSAFNLVSCVLGLLKFWRTAHPSAPMYRTWICYGILSINTSVCSTIFHTRDTWLTEKLDYLFAMSLVYYHLFIYLGRKACQGSATFWPGLLLGTAFVFHLTKMFLVDFDHEFHTKVGCGWANPFETFDLHPCRPSRPKTKVTLLVFYFFKL